MSPHNGIPVDMTVQGKKVQITSATSAIDTGTTLIGGPSTDVQNIWAQVPGSLPLNGDMQGFYGFRKPILLSSNHAVH
jgi:cathepsin D